MVNKKELNESEKFYNEYMKAFKKRPSKASKVIAVVMLLWFTLVALTTFLVFNKLVWMAWSWLV